MYQQIIAAIIIVFFIIRLVSLKRSKNLNTNEFVFWLIFWILAGIAVAFLKQIDQLVAKMGFSSSGINFLLYIAVIVLFYLIFRLRLRIFKLDKALTKLVRDIALNNKKD